MECRVEIMKRRKSLNSTMGTYCANPLNKHDRQIKGSLLSSLEAANENLIEKASSLGIPLTANDYLCRGCRKELHRRNTPNAVQVVDEDQSEVQMEFGEDEGTHGSELQENASRRDSSGSSGEGSNHSCWSDDDHYFRPVVALDKLRKVSYALNVDVPSKGISKSELVSFFHNVSDSLKANLVAFLGTEVDLESREGCKFCQVYIDTLVEKFRAAESKSDKYRLLTSTPSWISAAGLETIFSVSKRMSLKAITLRHKEGPCSFPAPKIGNKISEETENLVKAFYLNSDNSRVSPNARDVVSVTVQTADGPKKVLVGKQLIMVTMKQLYEEFKIENPCCKISVSKFAQLRPKQCVWGFQRGFQQTCLCQYHTNFDLMVTPLKTKIKASEFLAKFFCEFKEECYLGACSECPKFSVLTEQLETIGLEKLEYWQWDKKPGKQLELTEQKQTKVEYTASFKEMIMTIASYHFLYLKQRESIFNGRSFITLQQSWGVLHVDYGKNYSFVVPAEVQGFYWANSQATIHPFVLHYYCTQTQSVKIMPYIVISDHLIHDATTFHVFKVKVVNELKKMFPFIERLHYVSDGAGSQYKNAKNFANLQCHMEDFNMAARWEFSAPYHGKGIPDAMTAVAKRLTRVESLRRSDNFITTPLKMFEFLRDCNKDQAKMYIYVTSHEIAEFVAKHKMESRYANFGTIPGTRLFHFLEPIDKNRISCKKYTVSEHSYVHTYATLDSMDTEGNEESRNAKYDDYVAVRVGQSYAIGNVKELDVIGEALQVLLMRKTQKSCSFMFNDPPKLQWFLCSDIIKIISHPATANGRTYSFPKEDLQNIEKGLAVMLAEK